MNIFETLRKKILKILALSSSFGDSNASSIIVDVPSGKIDCDIYTNAALVLGKLEKRNPMEVAGELAARFSDFTEVANVEIASPGFINIKLRNEIWQQVLARIDENFGRCNLGKGEKVNLEFVSANPTGPMHIGHARGAIAGDVLAELLKWVGYDVTKEYYINDAGGQIETLVQSVYLRYMEALGSEVTIGDGLYPGDYLKPVARELVHLHGRELLTMPELERMRILRKFAIDAMMTIIKNDLQLLATEHDVFTSEEAIHKSGKIEESIELLRKKGLIYRGVLDRPKGEEQKNWQPREQLLFRSTNFGDDADRPLQKDDGSWTYFASDIAYHYDKLSRGFAFMILQLGVDHGGYVKRIKAIVEALSDGKARIDVKLHNIVNFCDNGVPVKMSKRSGNFLTVKDVIDEVGIDVTRFIMLTRKNDIVLDFDFAKVKEQSRDNPVFYVQYAHARACSLMRSVPLQKQVDLSLLESSGELSLIRVLARWPALVASAATSCEPHKISFYLLEVAEAFHALWGYGNSQTNMRFVVPDNVELTQARIFLARAVATVISCGLKIFNIEALKEMR